MKKGLEIVGEKFMIINVTDHKGKEVTNKIFDCHADALDEISEPGNYVVMPVYVITSNASKSKKQTNAKSTKQNNDQGKADPEGKAGDEMDERNKTGEPGTEGNEGGNEENQE